MESHKVGSLEWFEQMDDDKLVSYGLAESTYVQNWFTKSLLEVLARRLCQRIEEKRETTS